VYGFECRVLVMVLEFGFWVYSVGLRVFVKGFMVSGFRLRIKVSKLKASGFGFWVLGLGFGV
jgi:hypothetical protein